MKRNTFAFILLLIFALAGGGNPASAAGATPDRHATATPWRDYHSAVPVGLTGWFHTLLAAAGLQDLVSCPTPVKIMPLGDSITKGVYGSGYPDTRPNPEIAGYRLPLYVGLRNGGYNVDFVGSQAAGSAYPGFDFNHEGHPSQQDAYIASHIYNWLVNTPAEVILLHIGTNGLNEDPNDVKQILDNIKQYQDERPGTSIKVVVARIIDRIPRNSKTTKFNDNVVSMINGHPFKNNTVVVDMENGAGIVYNYYYNSGDMADNLHPYATGYEKMANKWLGTFSGLGLTSCLLPPLIHATSATAYVGQPFNHQVLASGNPAPTFSLIAPVPGGMTINANTGVISWTPGSLGTFNVTVKTINSQGFDQKSFTVDVTNTPTVPAIDFIPNQNAVVGTAFTYDVNATGNPAPTFSLVAPVPTGMTIDSSTGLISWTPGAAGAFNVTVRASNSAGIHNRSFTITVAAAPIAPAITPIPSQNAVINTLFTYDVEASGSPSPTFSLVPSVPEGMTIDATTGVINWTPFAAGTFNVTVSAANSAGTDDETFTIEVATAPAISPIPNRTVTLGQLFTYDVDAGGHPAPTFSLTQKPAGMTINPTTGIISWNPAATGTFNVTVKATNSQGFDQKSFTITVIKEFLTFLPLTIGN